MRILLVLIRKELIQIVRSRVLLPMMIVMPIVQLFILVYAANLNMKEISFSVLDQDRSVTSLKLVSHYQASPFFTQLGEVVSLSAAEHLLKSNQADLIIHIPANWEESMLQGATVPVQFLINGINNTAAVLSGAYAERVLMSYNQELAATYSRYPSSGNGMIHITYSHWYNPELDFKIFMVPGILVLLVSMVGWILTALNIVREKELGTIEQINVTPIRKYQFIMGKLIPFWCIALFELALGLLIGRLVFGVPMVGSLGLLFGFAAVYLISVLGIGLFFSSISETQQQVMFLNFFFVLTFILMSGIFTPVESMPRWAHWVNYINPLAYFMRVIRMIMLKGADFYDVWTEFIGIAILGMGMITLAVRSYRKRTA